jgi:hypothetical protein
LIISLALPSASRAASRRRADTGNHNQEILPASAPYASNFLRGRNNPIHPRFLGETSQSDHTLGSGARKPYPSKCGIVHARQDRYGQELRHRRSRASGLISGPSSRAHHFQAPQGMQVEQLDSRQGNGASYRALDRIWNVVEFQIQEYAWAKAVQFRNCGRAFGSE